MIGITKSSGLRGITQNLFIRLCLFFAGAKTINLTPKKNCFDQKIKGLLISGGTDLYPAIYKSPDIKKKYRYDHERDLLELQWLQVAKERSLPIFCICRGAQLLNVFEGGTLFTDVSKNFENAKYPTSLIAKIFFRKKINIKEKTKLIDVFNKKELDVNSMHSQSIKKLGDNLSLSAVEDNGVIQAVESKKNDFIIGVQFHPEFLYYKKEIRNLFKEFVSQCS